MRITFDDAEIPQIGGATGIAVKDLFGAMDLADADRYRTRVWGQSRFDSGAFGAFLNLPMPFQRSFKIELFGAGQNTWWMVEWVEGLLPPFDSLTGATLHVDKFSTSANSNAETPLFDMTGQCALVGLCVNMASGSSALNNSMEGDFRIYEDDAQTLGFRSSGFEDFFGSSYYFADGNVRADDVGLIGLTANTSVTAYRWFLPVTEAPTSEERLRLTHTNGGTSEQLVANGVTYSALRFYYVWTAPPANAGWVVPLFRADNTTVNQWRDTFGGSLDLNQGTSIKRPTYTAAPHSMLFGGTQWMAADNTIDDSFDTGAQFSGAPFTISALLRWDGTSGQQTILSKYTVSGNQKTFWLSLDSSHHVLFGWSADGSTELTATSTGTVSSGVDTRVTVVVDPSAPSVKFYLDGVLSSTATPGGTMVFNSNDAKIELASSNAGATNLFHGRINDMRIWYQALTAAQVASL